MCVGTVGEDVDLAADHGQGRESIFLPAAGHVRALQAHVEEQQQGNCTRFFRNIRLSIAIIVNVNIVSCVCVRACVARGLLEAADVCEGLSTTAVNASYYSY